MLLLHNRCHHLDKFSSNHVIVNLQDCPCGVEEVIKKWRHGRTRDYNFINISKSDIYTVFQKFKKSLNHFPNLARTFESGVESPYPHQSKVRKLP
jgi:hypothetical protein